jgi:hypothetical protein
VPVKLSEEDPKHINVNVKYVIVSLVNVRIRRREDLDVIIDLDARVDPDVVN